MLFLKLSSPSCSGSGTRSAVTQPENSPSSENQRSSSLMPAFTFLSSEDDMRDRHKRSGEVETFSLRTSPRLIHCIESNTSHGQHLMQLTADSAHHNKVEPAPQLSWQCHSSKEAVGRGCCPFWSSGMTKVSSQTSPVTRQSTNPHF